MKGYNMKPLFKPLLAATILSLTIASVATAKPSQGHEKQKHCMQKDEHGHKDKMHSRDQLRFLHGIDLTDAQKDQIFELKHAEVPKMRAHMKARHQLKQELMQLSDNYSETKAKTIADKLATIERDSVLARVHHQQQVLNLLTPEQRKQVAENKEKFKQHRDFKQSSEKMSKRFSEDKQQNIVM
jgi:periplasmic protein CpxP/Spy